MNKLICQNGREDGFGLGEASEVGAQNLPGSQGAGSNALGQALKVVVTLGSAVALGALIGAGERMVKGNTKLSIQDAKKIRDNLDAGIKAAEERDKAEKEKAEKKKAEKKEKAEEKAA